MTICVLLCRRALTAINQVCVLLKSCHMLSSDEAPRMYQNLKASTPQRSVWGYGTPGSCVRPTVCICVSILKKKKKKCVLCCQVCCSCMRLSGVLTRGFLWLSWCHRGNKVEYRNQCMCVCMCKTFILKQPLACKVTSFHLSAILITCF